MRSSLPLAILVAGAIGACGTQPLTNNMTGSGGDWRGGTGGSGFGGDAAPGGTGGSTLATGGIGGDAYALCNTLPSEYRSALTEAETCQVGASGQCQQLVAGNLTSCNCPVYVTDSSALATIQNTYQTLGCDNVIPQPPCGIDCALPVNAACVATDGGSVGFCSYVPGTGGTSGTGGNSGTGGSPGDIPCSTLAAEYAAVLPGASSCTANAAGQCAQLMPTALSPCPTCQTYVTDRTVLDKIWSQWDANGCSTVPAVVCPAIACTTPTNAICVPSDAGGSFCLSVTTIP
jgi:hypothetical protein